MKLSIEPVPKPRMTRKDRWSNRPCVVRYYQYKDELNLLWGNQVIKQPCHLIFHLPMPKSWSRKKREKMSQATSSTKARYRQSDQGIL